MVSLLFQKSMGWWYFPTEKTNNAIIQIDSLASEADCYILSSIRYILLPYFIFYLITFKINAPYDEDLLDRSYTWGCRNLGRYREADCQWSGYVNDWRQDVNFQCNPNQVIAGTRSVYSYRGLFGGDRR